MPTLELTSDALIVRLSVMERILSVRGDLRIPLAQVRGATEDSGFHREPLGLRMPGADIPGVVKAGTFIRNGERQFVYLKPALQPLVIELSGSEYARLAITLPDARAAANRINAAIAGGGGARVDHHAIDAAGEAPAGIMSPWIMAPSALLSAAAVYLGWKLWAAGQGAPAAGTDVVELSLAAVIVAGVVVGAIARKRSTPDAFHVAAIIGALSIALAAVALAA